VIQTGDGRSELPRLIVVFQDDSPDFMQLVEAARGLCQVVWLVAVGTQAAEMAPMMERLGMVVPALGEPVDVAVAALAPLAPDGIVTFSDSAIDHVAAIAARLGLRFDDERTALTLRDKYVQRQALRAGGVWTPPVVALPPDADRETLAMLAARAPYPAVLKPRRAAGSHHAFKVANAQELMTRLDELAHEPPEELLVEGYLSDGPAPPGGFVAGYLSVESMTLDGVIRHLATNGRTPMAYPLRETSGFIPSTLAGEELAAVLDLATRALRAVGVRWGFAHTEIKLTADGPAVIEINGRLGGGVPGMMSLVAGVDLIKAAMQIALGLDPGLPALPATHGVAYYVALQPPADARRIVAIDGVERLSSLPGVKRVNIKQKLGAELNPADGTSNMILVVLGLAPDHQGFLDVSEQVNRDVQVEYEYATGDD